MKNNAINDAIIRPVRMDVSSVIFFLVSPLEPVASTRPKFPSLADSQAFKMILGGAMTLLCPAQGFPVPSYR